MGWQGEWFGIDDSGHIAEFRFNDAGVAPRVFLDWCASKNPFVAPDARPAFEGAEPISSVGDLEEALPKATPFRFFTEAGSPFFPVFGAGAHAKAGTKDVVVWVDDEDAVAADLKAKRAKRLATTESGLLVSYAVYPAAVRKKLHGPCRSCVEPMWFEEYLIAGRGIYVYENEYVEYNGPYICRAAPAEPLTVKSLPKALRAQLERVKLAGCSFAKSPRVEPVRHLPCDSTNSRESYVIDLDGVTVRAIPGRDDNFDPKSWGNTEGPRGKPLVAVAPKKTKPAPAKAVARPPKNDNAKQRYQMAISMLDLNVGKRKKGRTPFVLMEVLLSHRRRCFVGEMEALEAATRTIVGANEVFDWLDENVKGWRGWPQVRDRAELERVFRLLAGDAVPGTANPFGAA